MKPHHLLLLVAVLVQTGYVSGRGGGGGGGGGGRGKSSKQDKTGRNETDEGFFFMNVEEVEEAVVFPPKTDDLSPEFVHFIGVMARNFSLNGTTYFYHPDRNRTEELTNNELQYMCLYYLEETDLPENDTHLMDHGVFFECEGIKANDTVVECCEHQCCGMKITYRKTVGKGAFTLIILVTIGLILILMVAWVYYSKSEEIKKRKLEDDIFEAKKKNAKVHEEEKTESERSTNSIPPDPMPS